MTWKAAKIGAIKILQIVYNRFANLEFSAAKQYNEFYSV